MQLTDIRRYPVKSGRGESLEAAEVQPWGLAEDRRWMVVDDTGRFITARERPELVLVDPVPTTEGLRLQHPRWGSVEVPRPSAAPPVSVQVWRHAGLAAVAREADAFVSRVVGQPAHLVWMADPTRRPVDPQYGQPADRVSFADAYPMLLTTQASLAELNRLLADGPGAAEGPASMTRFRPNLVVDGDVPWAEEGWSAVQIGPVRFRVARGCSRCVLTTVDPETAHKGKEPLATLARHRRRDGKVWFGVNLIPDDVTPDDAGASLRLGDAVTVLA